MYAKVAPDLVTASARGGVFSLIAVVLMAFMFITETYVFLGAGPVREVIDLEMDVSAELRMNVNLDFPNLECSDLTVELWRAAVRSRPRSMEKTLQVSQFNPISKRKRRYERIVNAKKGAEGGLHRTRDQAKHLARLPEKFRKVADGTLDGRDFFYHANDKVFHHFIHVVPTKYALAGVRKHFMAYQLLHQDHLSHHDDDKVDHWSVRFGFDISPMVAKVTNQGSTRWYDYVTNLLSIIGGAFTVVQLAERCASTLF
ncbi:hypothetical protein JL721_168 [Aureococcus anophagefferens]|nr:hypothetical protein JL721_168 [Aureococcus anophagefferens]